MIRGVQLRNRVRFFADRIYSQLGPGFSERVYHNAMEILLRKDSIPYESERIIPIDFDGHNVGNLRADIIVNKELVVEFKTIKSLTEASEIQARNYLRLTGLNNALLINYPPGTLQQCEIRCVTSIQEPEMPSPLVYKNEVFPRDI